MVKIILLSDLLFETFAGQVVAGFGFAEALGIFLSLAIARFIFQAIVPRPIISSKKSCEG
jgi:preprotein translocase subunit SecD